jgi:hypothetical protein
MLENETDHLPPSNAQVDNNWSYTSIIPYTLMKCMGTVYFHGYSYYILHWVVMLVITASRNIMVPSV